MNALATTAKVDVLGVQIDPLTVDQLHARMAHFIDSRQRALVLHTNVHGLNLADNQPWLRNFLNQADVLFCDGAGVMLGARLLQQHIPQRITFADWFWQLAGFAEERDYSFYFLGARPETAQRAADRLMARSPRLRIVGVDHGYFDKARGHPDNEAVIERINAALPDILVVGFGMPIQERWLLDNWPRLNAGLGLTAGAAFDYISGDLDRAPRWMTDHGLEWLGRLLIEPRRLWQRYVLGNPRFLWRVLRQRRRGH